LTRDVNTGFFGNPFSVVENRFVGHPALDHLCSTVHVVGAVATIIPGVD